MNTSDFGRRPSDPEIIEMDAPTLAASKCQNTGVNPAGGAPKYKHLRWYRSGKKRFSTSGREELVKQSAAFVEGFNPTVDLI